MKKILTVLIIAVAGFCLLSCKKKNNVQQVPVNDSLKAAFNFKPGTYWIYKDSLSGAIDSFAVTSNTDDFITVSTGTNNSASQEGIVIMITEHSISPATADTQLWKFYYAENMFCVYFYESQIENGLIEYVPMVNYPFQPQLAEIGISPTYVQSAQIVNLSGNLSINGIAYNNLAVINHYAILTSNLPFNFPYSYNDTFYVGSMAGLIKMNLNHPVDNYYRKWELQRYHIVK